MTETTILVTGATGAIGAEVCAALATEPEIRVRATLRTPAKRSLLPDDVETVPFDFEDPASIDAALDGVDKLFLLAPGGPVGPPFTRAVVDALSNHSVRQIVKQSSYAPKKGPQPPTDLWALETEAMVEETGIPWTFLRPPWCLQSFTRGYFVPMVAQGVLAFPFGDSRSGWIDTRDIGEVAKVVFAEEGHDGRKYTLTGPETVTLHEIAEAMSEASRREIVYRPLTGEEWIEMGMKAGQPREAVEASLALIAKTRDGFTDEATDTVEKLTGRQPRSIQDFARDYAHEIRGLRDAELE